MLSVACTNLPLTEAITALVAALVAALGTLAAKHRPAGARTRRDDRPPPPAYGEPVEGYWLDEDDLEPPPPAPGAPQGRLARALEALKKPPERF
jgi:hypothetical protein